MSKRTATKSNKQIPCVTTETMTQIYPSTRKGKWILTQPCSSLWSSVSGKLAAAKMLCRESEIIMEITAADRPKVMNHVNETRNPSSFNTAVKIPANHLKSRIAFLTSSNSKATFVNSPTAVPAKRDATVAVMDCMARRWETSEFPLPFRKTIPHHTSVSQFACSWAESSRELDAMTVQRATCRFFFGKTNFKKTWWFLKKATTYQLKNQI
jgi:hypothetical protein